MIWSADATTTWSSSTLLPIQDAAGQFRSYHMDMVNRRAVAKAKDDPLRDQVHDLLVKFLRPKWDVESDIEPIVRSQLAAYIMSISKVSKPTAYNRIDKMLTCGFLEPIDSRTYGAGESIIADLGIERQKPHPMGEREPGEEDPHAPTLEELQAERAEELARIRRQELLEEQAMGPRHEVDA